MTASASKKASKVPDWLNRQNRFHTLFQCPNSRGRARHVMLWTAKYCNASRNLRSSRPLSPRRERAARNICKTSAQSDSVMVVSMVGPPQTDHPRVTEKLIGESLRALYSLKSVHTA